MALAVILTPSVVFFFSPLKQVNKKNIYSQNRAEILF